MQADSLPAEPQGKPKNTGVGSLSLSPGDLPDPGIEPGSLALQEDSLPIELSGKPPNILNGPKYPLDKIKLLVPFLSLLCGAFCAQDSVIQVFLLLNIFLKIVWKSSKQFQKMKLDKTYFCKGGVGYF